ncbi:TRAP transporter large permease subunit [Imbroritus primus]|uniref:TRAP transporter large permease subunit n=1 Tax=Imbroritus primus TaxID=3058603 RepID=A0ACD3SQU7_9BURK|nr:TRAP transporter large permease subunit [Burkholderiaceae bacterium PBA]
MRKELWFGFSIMALVVALAAYLMPSPENITNGHLGLLMLALIVIAIMLGFPTAFTLMGMGVFFAWLAYRHANPDLAIQQTLDLMVQRTYAVMTNDVLISVPLFVFMGYLVERANLIAKLFKSLHLALARVPGSLAVATLVTCAIFATATGIVGAVVTLMGLLALPAMLNSGYNIRLTAGVITAGGCLGILIPPSVLLIVYGATAGVSVVQLYAGAFFPGIMLAGLYVGYVMLIAKLKPEYAPPLSESERKVPLPDFLAAIERMFSSRALPSLVRAVGTTGQSWRRKAAGQLLIALLPFIVIVGMLGLTYEGVTAPARIVSTEGLVEMGGGIQDEAHEELDSLAPPPESGTATEVAQEAATPPAAAAADAPPAAPADATTANETAAAGDEAAREPVPTWLWITFAVAAVGLLIFYAFFNFAQLEVFKMLLTSFFPLAILILAVLGSIVFGFATPTEAAAIGSLGGALLALMYRQMTMPVLKESVFLTAKTSAMVCWLFVGSSIFSAAFALLGGQALVEAWVLSMDLTPLQFMIMAQIIIFLLGWPLEWTEIIVIFMPIFIPLLAHFNIDPLFFGLLVAINLQTAFLSPPVAMSAFYLKGVAPPHVTLNQIFAGMMPFMGIQIIALILLYMFPAIGLWLPSVLYK